ncbi:type III pantothenate kinase [Reinekea marina]|uniref:Type III pantothenate kinase n=1 Tax=Reinekea marina TaxID=1310421 RepID=A0ABV7WTS3_9GAMM|nr:type III pantothenate kinase [Reinekea marina]MDN3648004.1 type III pantothenate kinase [Reinekea marina]
MVSDQPLFLDSGNTRLKWGYKDRTGSIEDSSELTALIRQFNISNIVLASVTQKWTPATLSGLFPSILVRSAIVEQGLDGLMLAYKDESSLGVDRWLNMLAAMHHSPTGFKVVVSMGTAMTIDVVDSNRHIGGYIVPGLLTQAKSLHQNASALPMVEFSGGAELGGNTQDCINHGILRSAVALVEATVAPLAGQAMVFVTGGDAGYLSNSLGVEHKVNRNLIFDGLKTYWLAKHRDG